MEDNSLGSPRDEVPNPMKKGALDSQPLEFTVQEHMADPVEGF